MLRGPLYSCCNATRPISEGLPLVFGARLMVLQFSSSLCEHLYLNCRGFDFSARNHWIWYQFTFCLVVVTFLFTRHFRIGFVAFCFHPYHSKRVDPSTVLNKCIPFIRHIHNLGSALTTLNEVLPGCSVNKSVQKPKIYDQSAHMNSYHLWLCVTINRWHWCYGFDCHKNHCRQLIA